MEWRNAEAGEAKALHTLARRFLPLDIQAPVKLRTLSFFRAGELVH